MNGLADEERRLLNAAKKIHEHKLVQIKWYGTLIGRASDGRIEQLLIFRLNEQLDRRTEKKVERRNDCRNGSIRLLIS